MHEARLSKLFFATVTFFLSPNIFSMSYSGMDDIADLSRPRENILEIKYLLKLSLHYAPSIRNPSLIHPSLLAAEWYYSPLTRGTFQFCTNWLIVLPSLLTARVDKKPEGGWRIDLWAGGIEWDGWGIDWDGWGKDWIRGRGQGWMRDRMGWILGRPLRPLASLQTTYRNEKRSVVIGYMRATYTHNMGSKLQL